MMTIGRVAPNDIAIPDQKISRQHAIVRMLEDGTYYLVDAGSANGTYLNGKRLVMPTALKDGDVISIGDSTLTFRVEPGESTVLEAADFEGIRSTMLTLGGKVEEITLLVCDIRSYTRLSESLSPDDLAALMAAWFQAGSKVIEERGGVIDKFIGDAIMVRWSPHGGADVRSLVAKALQVSQGLKKVCDHVNASFKTLPLPFRIGIGINTGRAVLGNIGSGGRREYTAMGDAVNLAFRFESETKTLAKDIVIGPDSYRHLPKPLWNGKLQPVTVKGKTEPIAVWALTFEGLDGVLPELDGG